MLNLFLMAILKDVPLLRRMLELGYTMFLVILLSVIVGLVLAWPVQLLWNFVFGDLYHINVLQAWALNILAGILFGQRASGEKK
jgi:type III secretory pathway component EscU